MAKDIQKEKVRIKNNAIKHAKILGVDHFGQAIRKLDRILLLKVARILKRHICPTCGDPVLLDDYTLGHISPWRRCHSREGSADLFWDVDNICLQCSECNRPDNFGRSDGTIPYPSEHESNRNVKSASLRMQLNFDRDLLGMDFGKANHRLFRKTLFEWHKEAELNKCSICGHLVEENNNWSVEHVIPWMDGASDKDKKKLFYRRSNCKVGHRKCNSAAANLGKGISGYNGVDWHVNKKTGYASWRARIMINGKSISGAYSKDPIISAEGYDMLVLKYRNGHGELNFPEKIEQYRAKIAAGWGDDLTCKICGGKHSGLGYCRKHYYEFCGGKEKRQQRYLQGKG